VLWIGQMGVVFLIGSVVAGACGGSAPMLFKRAMISRKSPARASPSRTIGETSSVGWVVDLVSGGGWLLPMGVTLLAWVVIRASFHEVVYQLTMWIVVY